MSQPTNAFLAEQRAALDAVLDLLIPPSRDGRMPGAGETGLGARIDAVARGDAGFQHLVATGLAELDERARAQGVAAFAGLPHDARLAALRAIGAAHPAFVPALLFHTYAGYYQEPRVVAALGVASHPPFPKGFALAPFDASRLAEVRKREKLWRDA